MLSQNSRIHLSSILTRNPTNVKVTIVMKFNNSSLA